MMLDLPAGWRSDPAEIPFRVAGAGADAAFEFQLFCPLATPEGTYAVGVVARTVQGREFREGLTLVDYAHVRRTALLSPARATVSGTRSSAFARVSSRPLRPVASACCTRRSSKRRYS